MKTTRTETREIVPRYYGLGFLGKDVRVFDSPSTSALAYIAVTSPDTQDGLVQMLGEWQFRKRKELAQESGYAPLFKLTSRQAKRFLDCSKHELAEKLRQAIKRNHGSYNLWDCSGTDAVSDLKLLGETLVARVRSQKEGWHNVSLKGAVRGRDGGIRYVDSNCACGDNYWIQTKGGKGILVRRNCLHIKEAELDSYMQDTRVQHPSRTLMREKQPHEGSRSLTFNFVDDPFLKPLVVDVLVARELFGESAYSIDRRLLTQPIAGAIMPLSLQQEVAKGRAAFEIIRQKKRVREIDQDLLVAQKVIDEAFSEHLRRAGFQWQGHCLELGREAYRYENENFAVSLVMNSKLPFYVVRDLRDAKITGIFSQDFGVQEPYAQLIDMPGRLLQTRLDDRTRKMTKCRIEPAVRVCIPGAPVRSLRYDLPERVIESYRKAIRHYSERPETDLKQLRIKF